MAGGASPDAAATFSSAVGASIAWCCLPYLRRKDGLGTPESLAEWRESFSSDIFDGFVEAEFIAPGEAETAAGALDELEVKPRPKENSGIKPSDYPEFNGRGDGWFIWRLEYEATAEMAGMKDVLNVVDSTDHLKKRLDDHQYDDAVTYQYSTSSAQNALQFPLSQDKPTYKINKMAQYKHTWLSRDNDDDAKALYVTVYNRNAFTFK
jgi:hypothetical protein